MNVRRFRALHAAGASYAEIARACGVDWRTVRKYLAEGDHDVVSAHLTPVDVDHPGAHSGGPRP